MTRMQRDKSIPTTQRCALLQLLSERKVLSPVRLRIFEPMEGMTDGEKEAYAEEMIKKIRAGEVDLESCQQQLQE